MFGIGWGELTLIFILILILFGPQRAQGIFRAFGKGLKEFKDAMSSMNVENPARPADFQQKKPVEKTQKPEETTDKSPGTADTDDDNDKHSTGEDHA